MTDPRREGTGGRGARTTAGSTEEGGKSAKSTDDSRRESRTAGTNRDFDETQESKNQGHGHPREEPGTED